jgi:hypothetical protein
MTMRTAIFTVRNNTTLAIEIVTDEVVDLVQMGQVAQTGQVAQMGHAPPPGPIVRMGQEVNIARLSQGKTVVKVQAGVFKLISKQDVRVTPDATDVKVAITPFNKGDWPDLTLSMAAQSMGADPNAVALFLTDAKSEIVE